jgi:ribosomal protein S18 acetylase RimI-like enzyme
MENAIAFRLMESKDVSQVIALFNRSCESGEVVYSPLSESTFENEFMKPNMRVFVAAEGLKIAGFVHGTQKDVFLPGQTHENTPGYLTLIFVDKAYRRRGIGKKLADMLADSFLASGKKSLECSESNPLHLNWRIPGTIGHDHNKAPGVDENCGGYGFLKNIGYEARHHEIAMYMDLKDYVWHKSMTEARERLSSEGIFTGRYDAKLGYEFDGMCDRVGSEYWRHVLQMETAALKKGMPCEDPDLWPDGIEPSGPRPILAATYENHIVGFTGPVDKQKSGRGWFTGICVDPDFGRRSIGEVLFNQLMQEFVNEGAAFTTLFTGLENHAQRIYARAGLRVVCNFAVMVKPLKGI